MSQYSENKFVKSDNHSWSLLFQYITNNTKVLDVGCSSGTFGETLIKEKHCVVDGIEIFHDDAIAARKKLRNVYELNIESDNLKQITDKYDYVIFADVIEHLIDPVAALDNVKKLLKPSGVVLYSIPNMAHISIRLALLSGDFDYTETGLLDETHLHFYNHKNIERVFYEAGYNIDDQKYTYMNYPNKYIEKRVDDTGLEIKDNKKFNKIVSDVDAQAFQFIGRAVPNGTKKKHKTITKLPHKKDADALNSVLKEYKNQVTELRSAIAEQHSLVSEQQHIINQQSDDLRSFRNSLSWKITKPLRATTKLINRRR